MNVVVCKQAMNSSVMCVRVGIAANILEAVEDVKLQLNSHARGFAALTTEVRNALQLLPPLHPVVPLNQNPTNAPNFNLPLRHETDLPQLNMLLADKQNIVAFVSVFECFESKVQALGGAD